MRSIVAAACAVCFVSAFASARLVVPAYPAPLSMVRAGEAGKISSSLVSFWLREAPGGETADAFQNTPGGQAGNPSIMPAPAAAPQRAIAPPRMIAPAPASAPKIPPVVPLETPRTAESRRAIHLAVDSSPARVDVQLDTQLNSATSRVGDTWRGTLARGVVLDGQTIARAGDQVTGKVTFVRSQARSHSPGQLTLRLTAVNRHPVSSSAFRPKPPEPRDGAAPGAGTAMGALAGGAAVGADAGAGAGTAAVPPQNRREVVLPAASTLTFTVTEKANPRRK
jgi:hypothetical protein